MRSCYPQLFQQEKSYQCLHCPTFLITISKEVKDIDDIENGYFNDTSESVSFRSDNRNGKSDFGNPIYDIKDKKIQLTEKKLLK